MIEPLRLSFELHCAAAHAFQVWTAKIGLWWPTDHTVSGEPDARVILEPRVGGRILERTGDGTEHDWGEITAWEPPWRLGYLWHIRRDRADATDVKITFTEVAPDTTRVDIEHRGWERLGAQGEQWRDANRAGWTTLLPHLVAYLAAERSGAPD